MSRVKVLKRDLNILVTCLTPQQPHFQVLETTLDEICFRFVDQKGKQHDIYANFLVSLDRNYNACFFLKCLAYEMDFSSICTFSNFCFKLRTKVGPAWIPTVPLRFLAAGSVQNMISWVQGSEPCELSQFQFNSYLL